MARIAAHLDEEIILVVTVYQEFMYPVNRKPGGVIVSDSGLCCCAMFHCSSGYYFPFLLSAGTYWGLVGIFFMSQSIKSA